MPVRMYHDKLGREITAADERQAAVYAESGWKPAPEPEARPGYEPEPVTYEPVTGGTKAAKRPSKSTES